MATRQLGNYRITDYLGSGGFGSVFKAEDVKAPGRVVAIKELHKKHTRNTSIKQRFFQEAVAMARLDHPNLPRLFTFGEDGGSFYLVMEFVSGTLLSEEIERTGRLAPERARAVIVQVLEAVSYAHRNGIIHRDLKPDNIMIADTREGLTVKVLDFGIARLIGGENLTMTGEGFGTPNYMSPERISVTSNIDQRTDIYSLGIIMFEMLTGKAPFESKATDPSVFWSEIRRLHESEPLPALAPFGVPADLEAIVNKAAAKRADDRFATADEMLATLRGGAAAALLLTTSPPGANVYIDNVHRGVSDDSKGRILVEGLTPGLHGVRVEKAGYNPYRIDILLEDGSQTPLQVALAARSTVAIPNPEAAGPANIAPDGISGEDAKTALLMLETLPAGSVISLGNSVVTRAGEDGRATLRLSPGTHRLTVRTPTGAVRREVVTVSQDELGFSRMLTVPAAALVTGFGDRVVEDDRSRLKRRAATLVGLVIVLALGLAAYLVLSRQAPEQSRASEAADDSSNQAAAALPSPDAGESNPQPANTSAPINPTPNKPLPTQSSKPAEPPGAPPLETNVKPTAKAEAATTPPPVSHGEVCAVAFVVGSNNQPIEGARIRAFEEAPGGASTPHDGRTGPQGRWRVCGLAVGSRLRVAVIGPRYAVLARNEITVGPDRNAVFLKIEAVREPDDRLRPGVRRPRYRRP